ncbi:hypothetical protein C8237_10065 [Paracidovorax avenae]|uniref:glycosyltransferase n=1 Tax=Paracidovorax avenae TaxID=80867 RepID=UPI000D1FE4C5|nr:glycosyltransferase [Paracidovorax avenae]AVS81394.1 hypothetical protein C8237_10065 [Paracidovorax avenae]
MKPVQFIRDNHARFLHLLEQVRQLVQARRWQDALDAAAECASHAWLQHSGIFASVELESLIAQAGRHLSERAPAPPPAPGGENRRRLLTIMTSAHSVGGHSRIAWRWCQLDPGSKHTLVLTQQAGAAIPEQLLELQAAGRLTIVLLEQNGWDQRIHALQALLAQADYAILLTHPHDVLPCAAVPSMENAPPVIAVDHASHVFWLGVSITQVALNTATFLLEGRRGIGRQHIGGALLPMNFEHLDRGHAAASTVKSAYGIPQEATLLLSAASGYKFWPIEGVSLACMIGPVLARHPDVHLLAVGVGTTRPWEELQARFPAQVHLQGYLSESELVACYHACDIYVDSLPLSSPTTLLEAAACGKPIVRFAPQDWRGTGFSLEFDCIPPALYLWTTPPAYESDLHRLIADPDFRQWRGEFGRAAVRLHYSDATFLYSMEAIYEQADRLEPIQPAPQALDWRCDRVDLLLAQLAHNMALDRQPPIEAQTTSNYTLQDWLAQRTPNAAQQRLVDHHLAAGAPPSPQVAIAVLCDGSDTAAREATLQSLADQPYRHITVSVIATLPGERVAALNEWAAHSDAQWLCTVEAGAHFMPTGLQALALELQHASDCRCVYADEIVHAGDGQWGTLFRPDINLDLLLSCPEGMARHWLYRRDVFLEAGGFDPDFAEAPEFDLALRLIAADGIGAIGHVSEPLLTSALPRLANRQHEIAAIERHLRSRGYAHASVDASLPGRYRIHYGHEALPLVSIIIPTKDQFAMVERCVSSLLEKTAYQHYEIILVDNGSTDPAACAWIGGLEAMDDPRIRVLRYPHPFNYSAINNTAARVARGEYLILLNNDTATLRGDWLDAMLNHAQRPEVGIVGAKLLHADGTIQHGGVVLGLRGPADHPFIGLPSDAPGYMNRLEVDQNYSAVTAACLMIRRSVYEEVGGLDEEAFKVSYNDVDLCLKVRQAGYLIVWTPHAVVLHEGSVSQKSVDVATQEAKRARFMGEQDAMYQKWLPVVARDPAYNPNLSLHGTGFDVETDAAINRRPLPWRPQPVVLALAADHSGCGHYRVIEPVRAMHGSGIADARFAGRYFTPEELHRLQPDTLVLQRQVNEEQLQLIQRIKRLCPVFMVAELDDYLPNLPLKNTHRQEMPKDVLRQLRRSVGMMDRFVVSTDALAEALKGIHPDMRVVQNRLPPRWWRGLQGSRQTGGRPRVGWAGGISHQGDLELITDVVKELHREVDWIFFGMCPDRIKPYVREYHGPVSIERYPAMLASLNLDLALAPLEQNLFNECKSNLRLLEYGACGYPVIASDARPYQCGLPVTLVKNRFKDWVDAIRAHVHDPAAAARSGDALRAAVERDWMLEGAHLQNWLRAWLPE